MGAPLDDSIFLQNSFLHVFADLPDPRVKRTREHTLLDILFGSLCGAEEGTAIADFARARLDWLRQYVPLATG